MDKISTIQLTSRLRWVERKVLHGESYNQYATIHHVLQQAWVEIETGNLHWRDVPVETENTDE